ncbi:MAG: hypothetical protein ACK5NT_03925 [Pyrinomonadaceae bacterium]
MKVTIKENENGSAIVIVLFILMLLMALVVLASSRSISDQLIAKNDTEDTQTYNAAEAGLEDTTRNFATVIETKLTASNSDLTNLQNSPVPGFEDYEFTKVLRNTKQAEPIILQAGEYQGLNSLRDEWEIDVTATSPDSQVQTQLRRRFFSNRIPLFQFGAFFNDDLELNRPPLFVFGGRAHTNGNLFVSAYPRRYGGGIFFESKVTASGEIVTDLWKPGTTLIPGYDDTDDVYFVNGASNFTSINHLRGSVSCVPATGGGILKDPTNRNFPYPRCVSNPGWVTESSKFDGNLVAHAKPLTLPIDKINVPLIEIIRRGHDIGDKANINGSVVSVSTANQDDTLVSRERFANKSGIRISLADSQDKLPQCANASIVIPCGVRLDAPIVASDTRGRPYRSTGYLPKPMKVAASSTTYGYQATAVNGNRLGVQGREVWMKVELVSVDDATGRPRTQDITEEFLSLGVTEPAPIAVNPVPSNLSRGRINGFFIKDYDNLTDSRSIVKLQRFALLGQSFSNSGTNYLSSPTSGMMAAVRATNLSSAMVSYRTWADLFHYAGTATSPGGCAAFTSPTSPNCVPALDFSPPYDNSGTGNAAANNREEYHFHLATFGASSYPSNWAASSLDRRVIVPFPIKMFDPREGFRNDVRSLGSGQVYKNGVMSLVDIDVFNVKRLLDGDFDGMFPINTPFAIINGHSLRSSDIPNLHGVVLYVSDRRGDADFDGRYTMEDVDPTNNSIIEEDLNNNKIIDTDFSSEAPTADSVITSTWAASTDQRYNRRAVRLINGSSLPGFFDSAAPQNTRGFTVASENGVYVQGNYNVRSVSLVGGNAVTTSDRYYPQNTSEHIPAAIVGDTITVLSNAWNDNESFVAPQVPTSRHGTDTQVRFAMISGDSITSRESGSGFAGLNGGIHNFLRFIESWSGSRLNYSGSMVNLYNAFNNNGQFKCCTTVYEPPIRDWTFEESFNDPNRLPPGTPFVYNLSFTGFERVTPIN